jgi:hypothetical protein
MRLTAEQLHSIIASRKEGIIRRVKRCSEHGPDGPGDDERVLLYEKAEYCAYDLPLFEKELERRLARQERAKKLEKRACVL